MSYKFHAIFRPEPEGGFTASVPSLPGCVSFGKTLVEARRMIEDAIAGYIVSLKKHGERVPIKKQLQQGAIARASRDRSLMEDEFLFNELLEDIEAASSQRLKTRAKEARAGKGKTHTLDEVVRLRGVIPAKAGIQNQ